jgi:hypothetical protein
VSKQRLLSSTTYPIVFLMVDSTDHITGKTGLTVTVTLSKNGAAFAAAAGAVSELSSGWYALAGNATDRNTLGALALHATATGADPTDDLYEVTTVDPFATTTQTGDSYGLQVVRASTCQAGSTTTAVVLDASASATNDIYLGDWLAVQVGSAPWQFTPISAYNGTTKTATVTALNATVGAPSNGDSFKIIGRAYAATVADIWAYTARILTAATNITTSGNVLNVDSNGRAATQEFIRTGTAQAGTTTTITLDTGASATNNLYVGCLVFLTGSTGAGQVRTITSYNGTTKIATVDRAFVTAPTSSTTFAIMATDNPALNATLQPTVAAATAAIRSGTAQTGSTANTIKLDSGASATNNLYVGNVITLTGGTGLGQTRTIVSYVGSTKVATVDRNWTTTPDGTTTFSILANITPTTFSDQGVAQAGASGSITLASTASAVDNIYNGSFVTILSGTDAGDTSVISAYNGTTKVATVSPNFAVAPDSTSAYAVIPTSSATGAATGTSDVNVVTMAGTPVTIDSTTGKPSMAVGGYASGQDPGTLFNAQALAACLGLPTTNGQALTYAVQQRNNKEHANKSTGVVTLYENDGTTAKSTQTYTSDATSADRTAMA